MIQLIVFCALIGMVLAVPGCWAAELRMGLSPASASGWWRRRRGLQLYRWKGIDAKMKRTAWRPTARAS